jgi:hypothetical protein
MTKALQQLKRFIAAKNNEDERAEIRAYANENADDLASAFAVTREKFLSAVAKVEDDEKLASALLGSIKQASCDGRAEKVETRNLSAQQSADVLGSAVQWEGNAASVDVVSLLASVLTRRGDMLVFACEAFTVPVYMDPLIALAKLERTDLTAFVDANGFHVRWNGGKGGVNLRPKQVDRDAFKVFVKLAARERIEGSVAA